MDPAEKLSPNGCAAPQVAFHQFSRLPDELQLKVWEEAVCAGPSMHIFDVCFPSGAGSSRSQRAFARSGRLDELSDKDKLRYSDYIPKVFLDALETGDQEESGHSFRIPRHRFDPSVYRLRESLGATCVDSSRVLARSNEVGLKPADVNTVYLPGPNRIVRYDNRVDVLHLRMRAEIASGALTRELSSPSGGEGDAVPMPTAYELEMNARSLVPSALGSPGAEDELPQYLSGLSPFLDGVWSKEMTNTLFRARRIAIDISETWTHNSARPLVMEEVAFLACTLQHGVEVLYLVDYCIGRCTACGRQGLRAADLQKRDGMLNMELHGDCEGEEKTRPGDVIYGVGKTYREVFDLEGMGWDGYHPTFAFARLLDDAIRSQQNDAASDPAPFRGVRILVVEDEPLAGRDASILVNCSSDADSCATLLGCSEPGSPYDEFSTVASLAAL